MTQTVKFDDGKGIWYTALYYPSYLVTINQYDDSHK